MLSLVPSPQPGLLLLLTADAVLLELPVATDGAVGAGRWSITETLPTNPPHRLLRLRPPRRLTVVASTRP